jgi:S-methylmethionine-dependent homocysteine/selenocysteine methylase
MVNCAHPSHFADARGETAGSQRLRGIRANASRRSHAELDEATDLDDGDPVELAQSYAAIRSRFPWINILGGCCGTDHRHIEQISAACDNDVDGEVLPALTSDDLISIGVTSWWSAI